MSTAEPTQFKAVLDPVDLANVPRDLSFHRVTNPAPKVLTPEQIEYFNREGFVKGIRVYSDAEILDIREYFDRLLSNVVAAGGDSYSISSAHLRHARVWDILTDAKIVACVKDLLGENVVGWGSHFFCKLPKDGKRVAWHQDSSYWPLTPSKSVTVWLAIDDADVENACMRFVSGSHHYGAMTFHPSDPSEHNVLNQTIENVEQYGKVVNDCLKAGEISLHSNLLLHGSEANMSDRRRCGLTLRYAPVDVRAYMDWNLKGVWVSGSDPSGHWANRARPADE